MENTQILTDLQEMIQIPVATRNERAIADYVIKKLQAFGLEITEDDTASSINGNTGNLIAILKGDPTIPPILLSSHMDRVANNGHITPIIDSETNTIHSDGTTILAADDVSGICIILETLRNVLAQNLPHGDIEVALSVCEEDGVQGSRHFDFTKFKSKMAFVFDSPGRAGRIITQAPAKGRITIGVHGRTAHAGNEPEKGLNALRIAADLLMNLPDGRITPETTTNFSIIQAGSTTNVVCGFTELIGEQRSTNAEEYERNTKQITEMVTTIAQKYNTTIDLTIKTLYETFTISAEENIVKIAVKAFQNIGIEPTLERGGGGMDANHFNAHGIKAIGIACGYRKNHTPDETLSIDDFLKSSKAATELIKVVAAGSY